MPQITMTSGPAYIDHLFTRLSPYVSAAQRQQLRLSGELPPPLLREVAARLVGLRQRLATYLPRLLLEDNPELRPSHGRYLTGTVLSADLIGFTPLTESAGREGTIGFEALNTNLNRVFEVLQGCLLHTGGDLLSFQGDGALAFFPALPEGEDLLWAVRAALRMQRSMAPFDAPPAPLRIRIGLAQGTFYMAQVGSSRRKELFLCGGPLPQAFSCEQDAAPGRVLVAAKQAAQVSRYFRTEPFDDAPDGRVHVVDDLGDALYIASVPPPSPPSQPGTARDPLRALERALLGVEALAPFFPRPVLTRILEGVAEQRIQAEHRAIAVSFLEVGGLTALADHVRPLVQTGDNGAAQALLDVFRRYALTAFEVMRDNEGIISHIDPVAAGVTLLGVFGAPVTTQGTPHRAVNAVYHLINVTAEINALVAEVFGPDAPPLYQRAGVTYGPIFIGEVGPAARRNYVTAGDDVNLAARLMSLATPGTVLVSPRVNRRTARAVSYDPLPPQMVKGRREPMRLYALQAPRTHLDWLLALNDEPLVGREGELDALRELLIAGGSALILGSPGVGKTRLLTALLVEAHQAGWRVLAGRSFSDSRQQPYAVWGQMICETLDLRPESPQLRERLAAALATLGQETLADTLFDLIHRPYSLSEPLAGMRTNALPSRDADLQKLLLDRQEFERASDRISPTYRRIAPRLALRQLLLALAQHGPLLLALEDLHRAELETLDLLEDLLRDTSNGLIIAATAEQHPSRLLKFGTNIGLNPLQAAHIAELAGQVLGGLINPSLQTWLLQTTGGNPLFLNELLLALADEPQADDTQANALAALAAGPTSARETLLSHLDRLPDDARQLIGRASIIGHTFPARWLNALLPDSPATRAALRRLAGEGLITPPPPAAQYEFAHDLLREVVYTNLALADRRTWHLMLADWLAAQTPTEYTAVVEHYTQAGAPTLAAWWALHAGELAWAEGSHREAEHFYRRALTLSVNEHTRQQAQTALAQLASPDTSP